MARRHDPDRRDRIIDAALRVVAAQGIAGLSHRSVAAEADVPLGSTTYHFATLDELLVAALSQYNQGFAGLVRGEDPAAGPEELAGVLAALTGEWLSGGSRAEARLVYELYCAALRRPALRPVAAAWADGVVAELAAWVDPGTGRAVAALIDGICLQVLLTGAEYEEGYAREMLRRIIAGGSGGG